MALTALAGEASSLPYILVTGSAAVGKSTLCQRITGSQQPFDGGSDLWPIETKYYTANVQVREARQDAAGSGGQPEALVLVFSLANPETLIVAQAIAEAFDLEAVEVKLLCGTHSDALLSTGVAAGDLETVSQPSWFQEAFDWSIENGFEFVVCCPAQPSTDQELILDGDRQGVARVVEALQAHTWPNLVLLPQGKSPSPLQSGDGHGLAVTKAEPAGNGGREAGAPPSSAQVTAEAGASPAQARANGGAGAATAAAEAVRLQHKQHELRHQQEGPLHEHDTGEGEDAEEAERMLDGLERLMEEVQGHKARLATLSDDERREQAAAIALRMMEMLGIDDEDSASDGA